MIIIIDIVTNRLGVKIPRGMVANQNVLDRDASFYLHNMEYNPRNDDTVLQVVSVDIIRLADVRLYTIIFNTISVETEEKQYYYANIILSFLFRRRSYKSTYY